MLPGTNKRRKAFLCSGILSGRDSDVLFPFPPLYQAVCSGRVGGIVQALQNSTGSLGELTGLRSFAEN